MIRIGRAHRAIKRSHAKKLAMAVELFPETWCQVVFALATKVITEALASMKINRTYVLQAILGPTDLMSISTTAAPAQGTVGATMT